MFFGFGFVLGCFSSQTRIFGLVWFMMEQKISGQPS